MIGMIASVVDRRYALLGALTFLGAVTTSALLTGALFGSAGTAIGAPRVAAPLALALIGGVALLGAASDASRIRLPWPYRARQVSAGTWRRGPLTAAALWGFELGVGLLTHVPAKIHYTLVATCLLGGTVNGALLYCVYGAMKGVQPLVALLRRSGTRGANLETPRMAKRIQLSAEVATVLAPAGVLLALVLV